MIAASFCCVRFIAFFSSKVFFAQIDLKIDLITGDQKDQPTSLDGRCDYDLVFDKIYMIVYEATLDIHAVGSLSIMIDRFRLSFAYKKFILILNHIKFLNN